MDDENPILDHVKRALAVIVGAILGLIAVTLVIAITASSRHGEPIQVKEPEGSALASPYLAAASPKASTPEELFHLRCAPCHGPKGRGDGPLAPYLSSAPRDLVKGPYWLRSTPAGTAPTRDDLRKVIERGIPGTAMPGFEDFLGESDGETDGVDRMIALLVKRSKYLRKPGTPLELEEQATGEDWELKAGRAVYEALGCASCHGDAGLGDGPKAGALKDRRGLPLRVPDLSAPWDFRRGGETHLIWMTLELGMGPRHMPDLQKKTSKGDRLALAAYIRSLSRKLLDSADMKAARERRGQVAHGRDMVAIMACQRCHTPLNDQGLPDLGRAFAGGTVITTPSGDTIAGNITPDKKNGIGTLSDEDLIAAITEGRTRDGRQMDPNAMPWTWFSKLTQSDRSSIVAYLRTLPARPGPSSGRQEDSPSTSALGMMFGGGAPAILLTSQAGGASPETKAAVKADDDEPENNSDEATPASDKPQTPQASADETEATDTPQDDAPRVEEQEPGGKPQNILEAKQRLAQAKQRLSEAAADFAQAKAQYEAFQKGPKKKKRQKKGKKKKRRRGRRRR